MRKRDENRNVGIIKQLILFFLLIFGSQHIYAQSNYKQGYIITNENDTMIGWIDYRTDKMNAKICRFKKDITDETTETYAPGQITGYRFSEEGKFYVTRNIEIDGIPQTVFLEYLLQGIMNLYFLSDQATDLNYYFFEDKEGKITYVTKLPDKTIVDDDWSRRNYKDKRYRGLLAYTFQEYESIQKKAEKLDFTHKSMIGLAKEYHKQICTTGEECIEFETKPDNHYVKMQFSISGGIEYQLSRYKKPDLNFKPHFAPFIKAGVDFSIPRWMKSVSLSFNVYLTEIKQAYKGDVDQIIESYSVGSDENMDYYKIYLDYWDYSAKAYQFGSNVFVKYTYPKGKIRPSCQIGFDLCNTSFGGNIHSYKKFTAVSSQDTDNESFSENEDLTDYANFDTFNAGVGINFLVRKEQFLFLNVNYKTSMSRSYYWGNMPCIWQLELGYRF